MTRLWFGIATALPRLLNDDGSGVLLLRSNGDPRNTQGGLRRREDDGGHLRARRPDGPSLPSKRVALTSSPSYSDLPDWILVRWPNLDEVAFARFAGEAEKKCPVSKALNATITLDARLVQ